MVFFDRKPHELDKLSQQLRLQILDTVYQSGAGHIGGAFSSLDIIIALYYSHLFNFNHDHFILSAGHLALAHYAVLGSLGKFDLSSLDHYSDFGSPLQGHESIEVPGVEFSSGSLGQGLSFAAGLALGDKEHHTVCLTSDGEHDEGQIWEAALFANKYHQGNLINIIDYNNCQIDGSTDEIMPLGDLAAKYIYFGWTVISCDGHNFGKIISALRRSKDSSIYPACIIAKTHLGQGVSFMKNNPQYHDVKNLSPELYQQAKDELRKY
jgi:transketolase